MGVDMVIDGGEGGGMNKEGRWQYCHISVVICTWV